MWSVFLFLIQLTVPPFFDTQNAIDSTAMGDMYCTWIGSMSYQEDLWPNYMESIALKRCICEPSIKITL